MSEQVGERARLMQHAGMGGEGERGRDECDGLRLSG
jgi:hypothetical protein